MHLVRVDHIISVSVILLVFGLDPSERSWDPTGSDIEWEQALSMSRVAAQSFASTFGGGGSGSAQKTSGTKQSQDAANYDLFQHPVDDKYVGNGIAEGLEKPAWMNSGNVTKGDNLEQKALGYSIQNEEILEQKGSKKSSLTTAPLVVTPSDDQHQSSSQSSVQGETLPARATMISSTFTKIGNILEESHEERNIESEPVPPSSKSVPESAIPTADVSINGLQPSDKATQSNTNPPESVVPGTSSQSGMKTDFPWYHSGDSIHAALTELSTNCDGPNFALTSIGGESVNLDVVRVKKGSSKNKKKAFFVFGEHAREVVSPESGLHFLHMLCGKAATPDQELLDRVLETTEFVVVPNANPKGRQQVDAGNYCKRTNENGVDLNRNWGNDHRETLTDVVKHDEKNPGPEGFSEPETQVLKDLVAQEAPDIYLSVHSGAYLLGTPFGYTELRQAENEKDMLDVLQPISQKVCNGDCPFGDMAHLIGYDAGGCDIDYIKETLGTPYVFTWEIYAGGGIQKYFAEEAHARTQHREMNQEALRFFDRNGQGFLQRSNKARRHRTSLLDSIDLIKPESQQHPDACFRQFNPESQVETEEVTQSWSEAYLMLCDGVVKHASKA
eukprot:gnl/MRDRNA2_/MRDRNA2_104682_c0_seq1.p1 gnl/MRDRNA2_/MRDRNA2_104682_c0~~gnl/MRDRNA2_/MRDRNA2_104682_c0_seq1.p1  ORF type:complete len:615 (-),score=138.87 gnl/MRDRNA2_/MRDRNA2_104682_c0_seq1:278-2122(-)